jgi:hypothetical protein
MGLRVSGFAGIVPRLSPTLLQESQAQTADNARLFSGEIRTWDGNQYVRGLTHPDGLVKSFANIVTPTTGVDSGWVGFPWAGVSVATSVFQSGSGTGMFFFDAYSQAEGDYVAPQISSLSVFPTSYALGVPAPTTAPSVAVTGTAGADVIDSRVYVYTTVSDFYGVEQESAPSPPSADVTVYTGQGVQVSGLASGGGYNIVSARIYRAVTGSTTMSYEFVAEVSIGGTYTDTLSYAELGETLATEGWSPAPTTMHGITNIFGGSLAGFDGNTIYFSEPGFPHAWPLSYALTVDSPIVALAAYGQTIAVLTKGRPVLISGAAPGAMSQEIIPLLEPCTSAKSVVYDQYGVVYASPNGIVTIGYWERGNVTTQLFTRDDWQAFDPTNIKAALYDGRYFGFYPFVAGALDRPAFVLSREDNPALTQISHAADDVLVDGTDGGLYIWDRTQQSIYKLDAEPLSPADYVWKSKRFLLPEAKSFAAVEVDADYSALGSEAAYNAKIAEIIAANQTAFASGKIYGEVGAVVVGGGARGAGVTVSDQVEVGGDILQRVPDLASTRYLQLAVYGDGALMQTIDLTQLYPYRITPFRSRSLEFQFTGNLNIRAVAFGASVLDLRQ